MKILYLAIVLLLFLVLEVVFMKILCEDEDYLELIKGCGCGYLINSNALKAALHLCFAMMAWGWPIFGALILVLISYDNQTESE